MPSQRHDVRLLRSSKISRSLKASLSAIRVTVLVDSAARISGEPPSTPRPSAARARPRNLFKVGQLSHTLLPLDGRCRGYAALWMGGASAGVFDVGRSTCCDGREARRAPDRQ